MVLLYMLDYRNEPEGIEQLLLWSDFMKEHCTGLFDVEYITVEIMNHCQFKALDTKGALDNMVCYSSLTNSIL